MVPDWNFRGLDHLCYQILHLESTLCVILELYANFQPPSIIKMHLEYGHTWRILMVPDWSFGGLNHL